MARPLWLPSLRRVRAGNSVSQVSQRPWVEILEDRTVLSGRNTLPDLGRSTSTDFLAETRHADLTSSVTLEAETGRRGAETRTPEATSTEGGGGSGGGSGGGGQAGFFSSGPGYPLLPVALRPLFSGGDQA